MIKFSPNPLQSDLNTLRFVVQKDETILRALGKSDINNLNAALHKSNLIEKPVLVHGKHGEYWSTRKVNPEGNQKSDKVKPSHISNEDWKSLNDLQKKIGDNAFLTMLENQGITWKQSSNSKENLHNAKIAYCEFVDHLQQPTRQYSANKISKLKELGIGKISPTTTIKYNDNFKEIVTLNASEDARNYFKTENSHLKWEPLEQNAITNYIENDTKIPFYANALVRNLGHPEDDRSFEPDELHGIKEFVNTLDGAIAKSELTKPILVHRKVKLFNEMIDALMEFQDSDTNILTDKGYCSTTAVESSLHSETLSTGDEFAGQVIFHIKVPAGKGVGAWIAPLAPKEYVEQNEFLLPRGTQFKCTTDISNIDWESIQPGEKVHINLEVIGRKYDSIDTIFHKSYSIDYDYGTYENWND